MWLMRRRGSSTPLGDGRFRLFWVGRTVSYAGDSLALVALPFAVLQSGGGLVLVSRARARSDQQAGRQSRG